MTDKEATDILTKHVEGLKANPYVIIDECLYEAFSVALHALHLLPKIEVIADNAEKISTALALQPCEDCVSREALKERFRWLEKATKYGNEDAEQQKFSYSTMMMYEIKDEIDNVIDSLPSVQPQSLEQIKWERDTAIEQLKQLGYGLGEKVEPCENWYDVPSDEMTLEQARQAVKDLRKKLAECLWREPCEDAISRKAALDELDKYIDKAQSTGTRDDFISFQELVVKQLPSVKPQRPKGKWIYSKYHTWICSVCGENSLKYTGFVPSEEKMKKRWRYCSICGAKMEGEDETDN